jgi:hypothetical protein
VQEAGKSSNNSQEELQKVEADFRMLGKERGVAYQIGYTACLVSQRACISQYMRSVSLVMAV